MTTTPAAPLAIRGLHLATRPARGRAAGLILRGVDLEIAAGEVHALVGGSGAGKSMVARTVLGIPPAGVEILGGEVRVLGLDWLRLAPAQRREHLGRDVTLIPQDPLTALNPGHPVGTQVAELLRLHLRLSAAAARSRTLELLDAVRIRDPSAVLRQYPHELSGGMRQRVLIAMAFACGPRLIVADEPTTALDATVQREVLRLLRDLQRDRGAAVLFITHNLGLVAKIADRVSVLHAGRTVEHGRAPQVVAAPRSAYTRALFAATPRHDRPAEALQPVDDAVTDALDRDAAAYDRRWWAGRGRAAVP